MITKYDHEKVYDDQISPLMQQIIKICKDNNIPMIASFEYKHDTNEHSDMCTTYLQHDGIEQHPCLRECYNRIYGRGNHNIMAVTITH